MVRGVDADWQFHERRRSVRFKCRHKVDLLSGEDDNKTVAYVLNYSMGGVRISYPGNLKVGDKVKLRFPHPLQGVTVKAVSCEVLWRRKNSKTLEMLAGLKFLESGERMSQSWIAYFFREREASANDLKESRKSVRMSCKLDVVARSAEDRAVGQMLNLGLDGALIKINRPAEVGDLWLLDVSGLSSLAPLHFKASVLSCDMGPDGMYAQRVEFGPSEEEMQKIHRKYLLTLSKDFWDE